MDKSLQDQYSKHGPILDQPQAAMLRDPGGDCSKMLWWMTEGGLMPTFQAGPVGETTIPKVLPLDDGSGVKAPFKPWCHGHLHKAVENITTVYDFHATIRDLGLNHKRLSFYQRF